MGTPDYATNIFAKLVEQKDKYSVTSLFTQSDKKVGRKQILTPPHIKKYCLDNDLSLPIYQPARLNTQENIDIIKEQKPDFIIVAAYGQILPKEILKLAPCINLHASILPHFRGASPIQQAILEDKKQVGVTAMLMDEGLDTGDILGFSLIKNEDYNAPDLFIALTKIASSLLLSTLEKYENIMPLKQTNALSSYAKKVSKQDGLVEFTNAKEVYLKYQAYFYWPHISLTSGLKLVHIELANTTNKHKKMGVLLEITKEYSLIACTKGELKIYTVQPSSKNKMPLYEYLQGKRMVVGDILL